MRWLSRRKALKTAAETEPGMVRPRPDSRLSPLLRLVSTLPLEQEMEFVTAAQALAAQEASAGDWKLLQRQAEDAVEAARERHAMVVVLVDKLRIIFDDLRARIDALPEEARRRWRRWLRAAAETVDTARPRDDISALRGLWIEARDVQQAVNQLVPVPASPVVQNELDPLRLAARRLIDEILEEVRRLPSADETRMLARLNRLQGQLSSLFSHNDVRAVRILLLHLQDLREDIRRALLEADGRQTLADFQPGGGV
jgi:hypothetical protein